MLRSHAQPHIERPDPVVAGILKGISVAQRIALVEESNQVARLLMAGGIRYRHPDWSESQIEAEVARRMLRDADSASSIRDESSGAARNPHLVVGSFATVVWGMRG